MLTEDEIVAAFEHYLDCKVKETVNNALGRGNVEDRVATTEARDAWLKATEQ